MATKALQPDLEINANKLLISCVCLILLKLMQRCDRLITPTKMHFWPCPTSSGCLVRFLYSSANWGYKGKFNRGLCEIFFKCPTVRAWVTCIKWLSNPDLKQLYRKISLGAQNSRRYILNVQYLLSLFLFFVVSLQRSNFKLLVRLLIAVNEKTGSRVHQNAS